MKMSCKVKIRREKLEIRVNVVAILETNIRLNFQLGSNLDCLISE